MPDADAAMPVSRFGFAAAEHVGVRDEILFENAAGRRCR
jgi:hypothetical protein